MPMVFNQEIFWRIYFEMTTTTTYHDNNDDNGSLAIGLLFSLSLSLYVTQLKYMYTMCEDHNHPLIDWLIDWTNSRRKRTIQHLAEEGYMPVPQIIIVTVYGMHLPYIYAYVVSLSLSIRMCTSMSNFAPVIFFFVGHPRCTVLGLVRLKSARPDQVHLKSSSIPYRWALLLNENKAKRRNQIHRTKKVNISPCKDRRFPLVSFSYVRGTTSRLKLYQVLSRCGLR